VSCLGNSKLLHRELRNLRRVFNVGLRDLEYLPGNNPRDRVVAIIETQSAQSFEVGRD
jgi:hypothetical protein